jgi:hypothetical protein
MVFETDTIRDQISQEFVSTFRTDSHFFLTGRTTLTFPKPVKFESYSRHQSQLSDHRSVSATVELQIPKTNARLQNSSP